MNACGTRPAGRRRNHGPGRPLPAVILALGILVLAAGMLPLAGCGGGGDPPPKVLVIGLDGATWDLRQNLRPQNPNAIRIESHLEVDRDRSVIFAPLFSLLPGLGSYGTNKNQALFAGAE